MDGGVGRRRFLSACGTAVAAGFAGCGAVGDVFDSGPQPITEVRCDPETTTSAAGAGDVAGWATAGGTLARTWSVEGAGLSLAGVESVRTRNIFAGTQPLRNVAVVDGTAYASSEFEGTYAIHGESTERQWTRPTGGAFSAPLVVGDTVYTTSRRKLDDDPPRYQYGLNALDRADGTRRWFVEFDDHARTPPSLAADTLVAGIAAGETGSVVVGLDPTCGEVNWRHDVGQSLAAPVPAQAGTVFLPTRESITALDARDGSERWSRSLPGQLSYDATPLVANGAVVAVLESGAVVALETGDGTERWRKPPTFRGSARPAAAAGRLFATVRDRETGETNEIVALSLADGSEGWALDGLGELQAPPSVAGDRLYHVSDQTITVTDVETGDRVASAGEASGEIRGDLVVTEDALYYRSQYEGGHRLLRVTPDTDPSA